MFPLSNEALTSEADLVERFRREGCAAVSRPFIDASGVESVLEEIAALSAIKAPDNFTRIEDERGEVLELQRLERESDLLFDLARHEVMMGLASHLLRKPVVPLHVNFYAGPPGGPGLPWHQDQAFYYEHFQNEPAIALWIALDGASAAEGILEYVSGRRDSVLPHVAVSHATTNLEIAPKHLPGAFTSIVIPRGGCAMLHSFTIHRTPDNVTSRPRRALISNYRGSPYREWLAQAAGRV